MSRTGFFFPRHHQPVKIIILQVLIYITISLLLIFKIQSILDVSDYCRKFEDIIFSIFKDMILQSQDMFLDTEYHCLPFLGLEIYQQHVMEKFFSD